MIRHVYCGEVENLRAWLPDDPHEVALWVCVEIGPKHGAAKKTDTFVLLVATPAGLETLEGRDNILADRALLVMRRFDYDDLWTWLERTVAACEAESWHHVVEKLRLHFKWEFENFRTHRMT
ncbi:Imm8 family immunity protein [Pyxidicoccus xibeiensis]|uniref:Imm8 family immunity protein n=1 Tax=Pyxidicoccus xibeiensis TaxID=2906759 RepID=UPI0020A777D9|nr:Imm8 family immunity protein [Pyxidicoccus xibeiensis]MCP3142940.1 immunity 8 family protein [Pyxidicoccus xibeiensis]